MGHIEKENPKKFFCQKMNLIEPYKSHRRCLREASGRHIRRCFNSRILSSVRTASEGLCGDPRTIAVRTGTSHLDVILQHAHAVARTRPERVKNVFLAWGVVRSRSVFGVVGNATSIHPVASVFGLRAGELWTMFGRD